MPFGMMVVNALAAGFRAAKSARYLAEQTIGRRLDPRRHAGRVGGEPREGQRYLFRWRPAPSLSIGGS